MIEWFKTDLVVSRGALLAIAAPGLLSLAKVLFSLVAA